MNGFAKTWIVEPVVRGLTRFPMTVAGRRPATIRSVPAAFAAFLGALFVIYLVYMGELYPLRPDALPYIDHMFRAFPGGEGAWGGPTLIGAWAVHFAVAAGMQAVLLPLLHRLTRD